MICITRLNVDTGFACERPFAVKLRPEEFAWWWAWGVAIAFADTVQGC